MRLRTNMNGTHSTKAKAFLRTLLVAGLAAATVTYEQRIAVSESLDNLMDSKAMQDFKTSRTNKTRGSKKREAPESQWLRGIDPDTNFGSLWTSGNASQILLNWAGTKLPFVQHRRSYGARTRDFVTGEVELTNFDRISSRLTIMVPHPSIAPLVEGNVLEEFRKLKPPLLDVVGEKSIPLTTGQGMLYEHKKGSASLLIPIAQHGVINLFTLRYKDAQALIDIAKALDIDRLNHKLDS